MVRAAGAHLPIAFLVVPVKRTQRLSLSRLTLTLSASARVMYAPSEPAVFHLEQLDGSSAQFALVNAVVLRVPMQLLSAEIVTSFSTPPRSGRMTRFVRLPVAGSMYVCGLFGSAVPPERKMGTLSTSGPAWVVNVLPVKVAGDVIEVTSWPVTAGW